MNNPETKSDALDHFLEKGLLPHRPPDDQMLDKSNLYQFVFEIIGVFLSDIPNRGEFDKLSKKLRESLEEYEHRISRLEGEHTLSSNVMPHVLHWTKTKRTYYSSGRSLIQYVPKASNVVYYNEPSTENVTRAENASEKVNRVIRALSNPKWDFRTVKGLLKETGLSKDEVIHIIKNQSHRIRKSIVPDKHGNDLYTLRSKPIKFKERFAEIWLYLDKYFS